MVGVHRPERHDDRDAAASVSSALKRAIKHVKTENMILAPDCGMKYLPREVAFGKMRAMVEAAQLLRAEYA